MIKPLKDELMVQQQLPAKNIRHQKWQHMVAVIMLNQTGRKAVKYVLPLFLKRWPTPNKFLLANVDDVKEIIWPLGMYNIRFQRLKRITTDFLTYIRQPISGGKRRTYKKTRKQSKKHKSKRKQTRRK